MISRSQWNDLDGWDAVGGAAEKVSPYLKSAATAVGELVVTARVMVQEQRSLAVATHEMALAWDKVNIALKYELNAVQQQAGNQMLLDRIATIRAALDNIDWLRDFQNVANSGAKNIEALAKTWGQSSVLLKF